MTGAGHREREGRVPLSGRSIRDVSLFGLTFLPWFCRSPHGIFQMPPGRVKLTAGRDAVRCLRLSDKLRTLVHRLLLDPDGATPHMLTRR
jgi:hypothetical protein